MLTPLNKARKLISIILSLFLIHSSTFSQGQVAKSIVNSQNESLEREYTVKYDVAFGSQRQPKIPIQSAYIKVPQNSAEAYVDKKLEIYSRTLTDKEISHKIEVSYGYQCKVLACAKITYDYDNYEVVEEINFTAAKPGSLGVAPMGPLPMTRPLPDTASVSEKATMNFINQQIEAERETQKKLRQELSEANKDLDQVNQDLASAIAQFQDYQNKLNEKISRKNELGLELNKTAERAKQAKQEYQNNREETNRVEKKYEDLKVDEALLQTKLKEQTSEKSAQIEELTQMLDRMGGDRQQEADRELTALAKESENGHNGVFSHSDTWSGIKEGKELVNQALSQPIIMNKTNPATDSLEGKLNTPSYHSRYQDLVEISQYAESARDYLKTEGKLNEQREGLLNFAEMNIAIADEKYANHQDFQGSTYLENANLAIDIALDFTPGVSLIKDLWTVATGYNPITSERVSDVERGLLLGTLFVPATISGAGKGLFKLGKLLRKIGSKTGRVGKKAKEIWESIKRSDLELGAVPCVSQNKLNDQGIYHNFLPLVPAAFADDCLPAGLVTDKVIDSAGEVGTQMIRGADNIDWKIADRVADQLKDPRMGRLAGKITPDELAKRANSPNAKRFIDVRPDPSTGVPKNHINIVQDIDGKTIRITVPNNEFKIISVGPIQKRNIRSSIDKGYFLPLSKLDGWE